MFVPSSPPEALALLCMSVLCWGSWGNTAKLSTELSFPVFYLLFSIASLYWALILGLDE